MQEADLVLELDQPNVLADDAERHIVVGVARRLLDDTDDLAGELIECLDRRQHGAVIERLRFAEHAFDALLVDVEAENLSAELTVHDVRPEARQRARLTRAGNRACCGHP